MVLNWQVRPGSSSRSRSPREVGHLCVSKAGCHMESHGMGQDLVSKNIIDGSKKLIFKGVSCEFWRSFTLICTRSPRSCWFVFMSKTQRKHGLDNTPVCLEPRRRKSLLCGLCPTEKHMAKSFQLAGKASERLMTEVRSPPPILCRY